MIYINPSQSILFSDDTCPSRMAYANIHQSKSTNYTLLTDPTNDLSNSGPPLADLPLAKIHPAVSCV